MWWLFKARLLNISIPLDGTNADILLKSRYILEDTIEAKKFGVVDQVATGADTFELNVFCNRIQYRAIKDLVRLLGFSDVKYTVTKIL